jgi:1-deoxy-D-xylulose-5-phosphate reductoisomerase
MNPGARTRVVLLGATGSIGRSTLRVIEAHADRLQLVGVASRASASELAAIARRHRVPHAALFDPAALAAAQADGMFHPATALHSGLEGLCHLATLPEADVVLTAVVGTTGLQPTLAAIAARKTIALASKEILVLAGKFVMAAARQHGARLVPVDSEHNGLFQCLERTTARGVWRVYLTASGGAFRHLPVEALADVTPEDALKHPNWSMGPKITVDSATLANKGLEMIEAQWLFGLHPDQIEAVIHPQSVVHAMVQFVDGGLLAQLSPPSMTFAIQHALLHPQHAPAVDAPVDFGRPLSLDFQPIDPTRYPCLRLAREAMVAGGVAPAVFNAANEVAVAAFLARQVPFLAIPRLVEETLAAIASTEPESIDAVLEADRVAREVTARLVATL